jgi:hypothetical protein
MAVGLQVTAAADQNAKSSVQAVLQVAADVLRLSTMVDSIFHPV